MGVGLLIFYVANVANVANVIRVHFAAFCGRLSRAKAFGIGALSGVVEPVAGLITILLFAHIAPALPYLLAFAAGAMMYVVVEELIPESQAEPHSNIPTLGFTAGLVLMMILDVALG